MLTLALGVNHLPNLKITSSCYFAGPLKFRTLSQTQNSHTGFNRRQEFHRRSGLSLSLPVLNQEPLLTSLPLITFNGIIQTK